MIQGIATFFSMMRLVSLSWFPLAFLVITGTAQADATRALSGCDDDQGSCRETCTLEFGASAEQRSQLGICFLKCDSERNVCRKRVQQVEAATTPPKTAPTATKAQPLPKPSPPKPSEEDPLPELVVSPSGKAN